MGSAITPREFRYSALDSVVTGATLDSALPELVQRLGKSRVVLVASASLTELSGRFGELQNRLEGRMVGLFDGIRSHSPREDVLAALAYVRECRADLIVAIGGGSVIDACKVIQLAIDQGIESQQQLLQYATRADGTRGAKAGDMSLFSDAPAIRQIAVPTTLSGAEFSNNAGILDSALAAKEGYRAPKLCPGNILYDPALARHTPEWLWLSTAIRSLDHAIEGFCSADSTPFLDGHFLHAMRLLARSLPLTRARPEDPVARDLNQQAVWLACCGLGTVAHGASHGIGYILGSLCGVPHGYTSCVMLPAVLEWNAENQAERQTMIVDALTLPGDSPSANAASAVRSLVAGLGLPTSLQEVAVRKEQLDEIANRAIRHPVVRRNPRPLDSAAQVREILELAWR